MKKFVSVVIFIFLFATLSFAENKTPGKIAESEFAKMFSSQKINVKLKYEKDIDLKGFENYKFVAIELSKDNRTQDLYFLTDGQYIIRTVEKMGARENLISYYESLYNITEIPFTDADFIGGKKGSKAKIVYFGDFECPFCKKGLDHLLSNYKDQVEIYFKHFPLPFHKNAILLSKIYEAGKKMNIDLLSFVENAKGDNNTIVTELKKQVTPEKWEDFYKIMNSKEIDDKIKTDEATGKKNKITGTPTMFINGHKVVGYNPETVGKFIKDSSK